MPFEPQHVRLRNLTLSDKKQPTFGTALADVNLTHRPPIVDPANFVALAKEFYSNKDRGNKGHPWPTLRQTISQATSLPIAGDLTDWMAGWLFAFSLGAVTTTGAASPYTHTFKFLQSTNQMPVTTLYCEDTADLKFKVPDAAIGEVEISGSDRGPLQFRATLTGSGRLVDGAMTTPATPATPTLLMGSDTDILLGPQGSPASIKERVREWSVRVAVGLTPHRAPGGQMYASFMKIETQAASLSMRVAAKDTDDLRTLFLNDTLREVQINTNSGTAAQLNLKFPGVYLSGCQLGADGGEEVWSLESDENGVIKSGSNEPFQAVAINAQATWLTAGT